MEATKHISIKIPYGAASVLVTKRKKRGHHVKNGKAYNTNRLARWYGFYFCLKAVSESGTIHEYSKQIGELSKRTGVSRTSFYAYVKACKRLGLIKESTQKRNASLHLSSWETCVQKLGLSFSKFNNKITFTTYDFKEKTEIDFNPQYIIESTEIAEHKERTRHRIAKSIDNNKPLKALLNIEGEATTKHADKLLAMQMVSFQLGGLSETNYSLVHSVQACPDRSRKALYKARRKRKLRSTKEHICYLKNKLSACGLATVKSRRLNSSVQARANKDFYYRAFNKELKTTLWQMPDEILIECVNVPKHTPHALNSKIV